MSADTDTASGAAEEVDPYSAMVARFPIGCRIDCWAGWGQEVRGYVRHAGHYREPALLIILPDGGTASIVIRDSVKRVIP